MRLRFLSRRYYRSRLYFLGRIPLLLLRRFLAIFRFKRYNRRSQAGFVLPTALLVVLVVVLVIATLTVRSYSRTTQAIGDRQQKVIYNAASPAIERAKSKLEYLMSTVGKLDSATQTYNPGLPDELSMVAKLSDDTKYTFSDETRLQVNGQLDNAWSFPDPSTGNSVAYSIFLKTQDNTVSTTSLDAVKAAVGVVRNATIEPPQALPQCQLPFASTEKGWTAHPHSTATWFKDFQVDAIALKPNSLIQSVATLEFVQDRILNFANKWGLLAHYDLESLSNSQFNFNGKMHTDGSFFFGGNTRNYLVSAPASCLYGNDGIEPSDLSMNLQQAPTTTDITFQGQLVAGKMSDNSLGGTADIDISPNQTITVDRNNDSAVNSFTPINLSLDPLSLLINDTTIARDASNTTARDPSWNSNDLVAKHPSRVVNQSEKKPYLDDTYRADNRYGPKVSITGLNGHKVGDPIPTSDANYTLLTSTTPQNGDNEQVGLDGYWERRAHNEGLRVIVGQRLELDHPLIPPPLTSFPLTRTNEAMQRLTFRDDLAAVQAAAIYHHQLNNGDFPVACFAATVHPGTPISLKRAAIFQTVAFKDASNNDRVLLSDFFNGFGTNGWEYEAPNLAGFPNSATFEALNNLANYSSDPNGAYPPLQSLLSNQVNPDPQLVAAGDFSNLWRSLQLLSSVGYANLSLADRTYIQTAACTLGMLAYNIKSVQDLSYTNTDLLALQTALANVTSSSPEEAINKISKSSEYWSLINDSLQKDRPEYHNQTETLARIIAEKEQVAYSRRNGVNYVCSLTASLSKLCPVAINYPGLSKLFPIVTFTDSEFDQIKLLPKDINNWVLPSKALLLPQDLPLNPNDPLGIPSRKSLLIAMPNYSPQEFVRYLDSNGTSTVYRVPFKDSALFDGRELMSVRVFNFDLDLLRQSTVNNGDTWLPQSGLIYAFREDAVREDAIARTSLSNWSTYKSQWDANSDNGLPLPYRMFANPTQPLDPPLDSITGISSKAVDYYADPLRRSYGFRLKNGSDLSRVGQIFGTSFSFVSDQPVYIQADSKGFNLHQDNSGNQLQEFLQQLISVTWGNFYDRNNLNPKFAKALDSWQPAVVVGDAVSILSSNFCDGSIEDVMYAPGGDVGTDVVFDPIYGTTSPNVLPTSGWYGCYHPLTPYPANRAVTSYINASIPLQTIQQFNPQAWIPSFSPTLPSNPWVRVALFDNVPAAYNSNFPISSGRISPVEYSDSGNPFYYTPTFQRVEYTGGYFPLSQSRASVTSFFVGAPLEINATIVSNSVPLRAGDSSGGLQNFPRLLENWGGVSLKLSGAFIQSGFSKYATGPFDQDDWESRTSVSDSQRLSVQSTSYFKAPNFDFSYDVALQRQPPTPVARRFSLISNNRSEFYKEPGLSDPYIHNLRCATPVSTNVQVDPVASCP